MKLKEPKSLLLILLLLLLLRRRRHPRSRRSVHPSGRWRRPPHHLRRWSPHHLRRRAHHWPLPSKLHRVKLRRRATRPRRRELRRLHWAPSHRLRIRRRWHLSRRPNHLTCSGRITHWWSRHLRLRRHRRPRDLRLHHTRRRPTHSPNRSSQTGLGLNQTRRVHTTTGRSANTWSGHSSGRYGPGTRFFWWGWALDGHGNYLFAPEEDEAKGTTIFSVFVFLGGAFGRGKLTKLFAVT